MEERRNQNRENVVKRWKKQTKEGGKKDTTVIQAYNDCNTVVMQSKVKESKGEESKEGEKVFWENPSPYFTVEHCISTAEYEGYSKEEGQKFFDFYNSQGWKRGKSQALITDLVSAFRSWISRAGDMGLTPSKAGKLNQTNL
jgi:hypothetical protein